MQVKIANSEAQLRKVSSVLLQLRTQYNEDSLLDQIRLQQAEGYQIAYVEKDGEVLCVAGFVICTKLAWQKHIYVDDLVTGAAVRSTGAGKFIMDWLKTPISVRIRSETDADPDSVYAINVAALPTSDEAALVNRL